RLDRQPQSLRDKVFDRLFTQAEIATFTPRELREYEDSRKAYRDLKNSLDTAKRDGIKEGLEKGRAEGLEEGMEKGLKQGLEKGRAEGERLNSIAVAKELKAMGLDDDAIMRATRLSASDLAALFTK
ncbi:MAG: PD-(D/E)XK nuclease family transposase, partial [Candidatus Limisoma sp.]